MLPLFGSKSAYFKSLEVNMYGITCLEFAISFTYLQFGNHFQNFVN